MDSFIKLQQSCLYKGVSVQTALYSKTNKDISVSLLRVMIITQNLQSPGCYPPLWNTTWGPFILSASNLTEAYVLFMVINTPPLGMGS